MTTGVYSYLLWCRFNTVRRTHPDASTLTRCTSGEHALT